MSQKHCRNCKRGEFPSLKKAFSPTTECHSLMTEKDNFPNYFDRDTTQFHDQHLQQASTRGEGAWGYRGAGILGLVAVDDFCCEVGASSGVVPAAGGAD